MGAARTQTCAILVTDVVDSTRLTEELGDERMTAIWLAHDRAVRDLLPAWRGREADRTDGFLLLFDAVSDAVGFTEAFHRAMAEIGGRFGIAFSARAGIHWGPAIVIETSDEDRARGAKPVEVEGIAKPTAARVMSVAIGGQTLLSPEARAELGPSSSRIESHGHWRMKGVAEPLELFEIGDEGSPFRPPPDSPKVYRVVRQDGLWIPVRAVRHSLPAERDRFVGRDEDLLELSRRLDGGARLVTVTGIGGTGKTRLVTRYGWSWLGDWPGGVWFCDLSEARDALGIAQAVARALSVVVSGADPTREVGEAIAALGSCLVIVDNFEQVTREAQATLGRWLDRAADAAFLVTSREVLSLPGEELLALDPLPADDGLTLFVARAQAAQAGFALREGEGPLVTSLVALLDGLPLAIELAAARVRIMRPGAMVERMSERFRLLAAPGGRPDRHATLQGVLDWSWGLLSDDEQSGLAQLSLFEGGFSLSAAEAVLRVDEAWPADVVQSLVDKSLVRPLGPDSFGLLLSVQAYAQARLTSGRVAAEERHGDYFSGLGTEPAIELLQRSGFEARRSLSKEVDNLLAAARRAISRSDGACLASCLRALTTVVEFEGSPSILVAPAEAGLALPDLRPEDRVATLNALARAVKVSGNVPLACELFEEALAIAEAEGFARIRAVLLINLGAQLRAMGRYDEARARYAVALDTYRAAGNRWSEANALTNLGGLELDLGNHQEALRTFDEALAIHRELGNRRSEAIVLGNLGLLYQGLGEHDRALEHYEWSLAAHRELGNQRSVGKVLGNLGTLLHEQGRLTEARAHYEAAVRLHRELEHAQALGVVFGNLARLDHDEGRVPEALDHLSQAERILRPTHDHYELALILSTRAEILGEAGGAALAEAEAAAAGIDAGPESELFRALARARAAVTARG